jgi:hypothetical protein
MVCPRCTVRTIRCFRLCVPLHRHRPLTVGREGVLHPYSHFSCVSLDREYADGRPRQHDVATVYLSSRPHPGPFRVIERAQCHLGGDTLAPDLDFVACGVDIGRIDHRPVGFDVTERQRPAKGVAEHS